MCNGLFHIVQNGLRIKVIFSSAGPEDNAECTVLLLLSLSFQWVMQLGISKNVSGCKHIKTMNICPKKSFVLLCKHFPNKQEVCLAEFFWSVLRYVGFF